MEWITDALEHFFLGIIERIDSFKGAFDNNGFEIYGFLNYVWFYCIPNGITDIAIFGFMLLVLFALMKHVGK